MPLLNVYNVRRGLYSREINVAAWRFLLTEFARGHAEAIVEALQHLLQDWGRDEIEIFVKQLAACAGTNW